MMRKNTASILLCMLLICAAVAAHACTSFAVYTGETPVYGMNMDFFDSDYTLYIVEQEGFHRGVMIGYTYYGNQFVHAAMMNEVGFFTAMQDLNPRQPYRTIYDDGMVALPNLGMYTPYYHATVAAARDEIRGADTIHHFYGSHHILFADATGDATVLDVLDGVPYLTDIEDGVLVMTNFPNQWLWEKDYAHINGVGGDRYALAYEYIQEHRDAFDVDHGLAALTLTMQTTGSYPTQFSILHAPAARESYLFVGGDAAHVWKVSMDAATVETWRGFTIPAVFEIGESGAPLSRLAAHALADE